MVEESFMSSNTPANTPAGDCAGSHNPEAPGKTAVPPVPYEEWVGAVNRELHGDYFDERDFEEIEEEVLSALDPVPENAATGFRGFPHFVNDPLDHARSVGRLVYALYWAAWAPLGLIRPEPKTSGEHPGEHPVEYPGNHPENPELYEGFDHDELAWAIGVMGESGGRRLIFEDLFNLNTLSCSSPAELRSLHRQISRVVGRSVKDGPGTSRWNPRWNPR